MFVIVSDGMTTFGFSGVPTGSGTGCEFFQASVDYNNDGVFDETSKSFFSSCLRLDGGNEFTFLDGQSEVDASQEFKQSLLILYNQVLYFNIYASLDCNNIEAVADSGIYEALLQQLKAGDSIL